MIWQPNVSLLIEGVPYTSSVLDGVSITYGTRDSVEQLRAGYGKAVIRCSAAGLNLMPMDEVVITAEASTGTVRLFTGKISDIDFELDSPTAGRTTITFVSPYAQFGRRYVGGAGWPKEVDSARVQRILNETQDRMWSESYGDWTVQLGAWNDLASIVGTIDTGVFELSNYTGAPLYATNAIQTVLDSAMGHLYETTDGLLNYQAAQSRMIDAQTNGFTDIPSDLVLVGNVKGSLSTATIDNYAVVKDNSGASESAYNAESIAFYGRNGSETSTWLDHKTDAATIAARIVALNAYPRIYLDAFTLALPLCDDGLRDTLLTLVRGEPVRIFGLPAAVAPDPYQGFVEGWTWYLGEYRAEITLYVSDYALSVVSQQWNQVGISHLWNTISSSITWKDVEVVA